MQRGLDTTTANELRHRIALLTPEHTRQWGTMQPAQALAHCSAALEMALGDTVPKRMFLGRLIGSIVKSLALKDDAPLQRNSPTAPALVVQDPRDLAREQARIASLIDRFVAAAPDGLTPHPHSFFGRMTSREWAVLMYKHLDHHLRQFGT